MANRLRFCLQQAVRRTVPDMEIDLYTPVRAAIEQFVPI